MAEKKPSGFRFRLPWLSQSALASRTSIAPDPPTRPPRTTIQTSVALNSAQRPPFRPPRKAPAAGPSQPSPPPVPPKSPESAIAKTPDPNETESIPTRETSSLTNPPAVGKTDLETQPMKETQPPTATVQASKTSSPKTPYPIAKTVDTVEDPPIKETQTSEVMPNIVTSGPTTPSQRPPSPLTATSPPKPESQPQSPSSAETQFQVSSDPVSPSRPQTNSKPLSPSHADAQSHVQAKSSTLSLGVIQTQDASQTGTQPRPPSRSTSPPTDKAASLPSATTSQNQPHEVLLNQDGQLPSSTPISDDTPEIKRSTKMHDISFDAKPKEITKVEAAQTNSANAYSMGKIEESKSHKTEATTSARVPLHTEIKDSISKFIHTMVASPQRQYMDEKPASVVTLAGDNKGASMHLHSEEIQRKGAINGKESEKESNTGDNEETRSIINSNVQGINNSMMFTTSVKERNPGVHVVFSRDTANTNGSKINKTESMVMHKEEADVTPPQTIFYDPTIGSSHGGVIMDPNDSDPNGHEISINDYQIDVL